MNSLSWAFVWATLLRVTGATGVHSRQLDDPERPDCTTYSFSYPLFRLYDPIWMLVNGTTGGTHGDFWFTIHNTATNAQVECEVKDADLYTQLPSEGDGSWHVCKDDSTKFRFSLKTNQFQLMQSWVCENSPRRVSNPDLGSPYWARPC